MDKELKYNEALAPFLDIVEQVYAPKDQELWRWCHNPINENDFVVQAENPINVSNINIESASDEDKIEYIKRYALSAYTTYGNAVAAYMENREVRVGRRGEQDGVKFDEQKGAYVLQIHVKPEHGICDNPSEGHGHVNILTYKDVNPQDMATGDPIPVKPQDNNNEENAL